MESIIESFSDMVQLYPKKVAVKDKHGALTYQELDEISNEIANFIIKECNNQGFDIEANINAGKQGERIGILLPRKKIFVAVFLGIMKSGCCIVNINPDFPTERKNFIRDDSDCRCIISSRDIDKTGVDGKVFNVEDIIKHDENFIKPINLSKNENEGIILYTSGSTGVSKGVVHKSQSMLTMVLDYWQDYYKFTKDDNVAGMAGFSFTVVLCELLTTIIRGSTIYILDEEERMDFSQIYNIIKKHNITFMVMPPKVLKYFSKTYHDLPLKCVASGGEKVEKIEKTDYMVLENYGCSETGSIIVKLLTENDAPNLLGKPVDFYNAYLIDDDGNEIKECGIVGELCVTGKFLSLGYLNLPEQTAEKFVQCPFEEDSIMCKTGDLMEWDEDGNLLYHGRNDFMVNFNGMRVELAEIELAVLEDENIIESVCVLKNVNGEDNIVCYFSCENPVDDEEAYISSIKERIRQKLADYMIPSIFMKLDALPRNINGKISRSDLPEVDVSLHKKEFIKPSSEFEILVAGSFSEVLGIDVDEISVNDDFVSLGGNSLSAMKLLLSLKEKVDVHISSNELIELSTPLNISNYIKSNLDSGSSNVELEYSFDEICPLSESQLNVFLDEMVHDMGTGYNNPFKIDVNLNLSVDQIKDALNKLLDMYPILKARIIINSDSLPDCIFDANPEIKEGTPDDIKSFVRPFELDKSLSRYLIVSDGNSISLYMDIHHLIFDGTSLGIMLYKLSSILNNGDVDFVDNGILRQISFERNLDSQYLRDAQEFLDGMLANMDEVYDLIPSSSKDDEFEYVGVFKVDNEVLSSFLQNNSLTHNQFFASVFAYTLSRFTGSSKVLFNLLEDGRGHIDLSESVGMFVKTLPVLMDCKNQSVASFLDYSSTLINTLMKYDLYPFHVLVNEYDLNTNISFQYSHNLFKNDLVHELKRDIQRDLSFFIFNHHDDEIGIKILFSDKFSKQFIEQFANLYNLILNKIMNVNDLSDIDYNSSYELALLNSLNRTESILKYDDILDAFNANLIKFPNNKLVTYKDVSYTYSESAFVADKIAKSLVSLGVKKQDHVAFLVERSELYMFNILGILSAGAVYVPLDDAHPDDRIQFILDDTSPKVVIVSDKTCGRVKELSENIVILNISDILKDGMGNLSNLDAVADDLACILYTSGTTGVPKGVKITRKAIINFAHNFVGRYALSQDDIFALFASIGFDVSMEGIFSSIYAGACLNIIPDDIKLDMDAMNKHFIENGVTYAHLPAQVTKLFINQDNTSLKVLCTGGEKLGEIETTPVYRFVDTYGPTETFIDVTSINVSDKVDSSSIGHLFDNTKAYVLDEELRRVPVGAVGELYIAGYQVAKGYLNRPKETDEVFLDNPFDENDDYDVMYRTGDLVRVLSDGSLGIIGRKDRQVKIRGNRLELSEVESIIRNIGIVEDVTVQTIKNGQNNELVAYVVTSGENDNIEKYISNYISERKPAYMVPSFVVQLDEIPLTVNGKVNKKALPEVDLDCLRVEYVAPRTEIETAIVEAFEKVFNQEKISIFDDFTRLGGDSLTAIKLLGYLKDYNCTAADIITLKTPYAIANNIKEMEFDFDVYSLDSGCPLNESQLNVYLDIMANDKFDAYLIPLSMEISEKFDSNSISKALNQIFKIHPLLGMCISEEYEVPYLVKGSKPDIFIESGVDDDYIIKFLSEPFDLYNSLCRFLIIENNDGDNKLFAVFHHIIFDALSDVVFKQDLELILEGKSIELDDSFLKIPAFNQQIREKEEFNSAKDFYDAMLADIDDADILLESVSADGPGMMEVDLDFDSDLFREFLDCHQVSENVLFTSVFAYTLSRFVGNAKISFNIIENGRDRFNNFNSIGMYVNTLPLFVDCRNTDISSFMENMSGLIYDVMRYNYYPFRLIAKKYDIDSNVQFQFLPDWINDGVNIQPLIVENDDLLTDLGASIADLSVDVIQRGNKFSLNVIYSSKYSSDFIEHFAKSYELILQDMLHVNELSDINYITNEDIEALNSYNNTARDLEFNDVMEAFNSNLGKYPNNNLVSMNDNVYTYAEGAYIADKIAKKLLDLGVKSGEYVGFFTHRSEYYMFSVLGILSMGGVYVPLDDAHPDDRIQFILKDINSKVVIVSDDTYDRAKNLSENQILLNVSDILKEDIGTLSYLPIVYNDLACILYTSGTTGIPKGVNITRKSILNLSEFYIREYKLTKDDVYALFASISFDVGIKAIFPSICAGACLTIIPGEIKLDMDAMNNYFIKHSITHTEISTQVAKLFISHVDETPLKVLTTGGEKLGDIEIDVDYRFVDSYGPTETCVDVSCIDLKDKIDYSSIGFLLDNIKAYVLDDELRRVPIGAVGELFIAGNQTAKGYLNRDEETQKAFLRNPFDNHENYSIMYRTGDMVRVLPDGSLGIVGRRDNQVKIRGNRVELPEIEAVIREIDYVDDVTVQTIQQGTNNELVAYVVVSDGTNGRILKDNISNYVGKRKPEYMIPSFVIELNKIPLTVNGKVDKNALPEVDFNDLYVEYVPPRNETEKIIVNAFEVIFEQEKISINDDFVRLGGDSIIAIRLISLLRDSNVRVTARNILNNKTPALIAQNVIENFEEVSYDSVEGIVDLLPIQDYFFDQINKDNYTQEFILKANCRLDIDKLQNAIDELTNQHDILRAVYRFNENNAPIQEISPLNTHICTVNEFNISEKLEKNMGDILENSINSIDMTNKIMDVNLIHCNDESYLTIVLHHLIVDGVSWSILINDLTNLYTQTENGEEIKFRKSYPYKKWVDDVKNLVEDISSEEKQKWISINEAIDESDIKGQKNRFEFNIDANYDVNNLLMLSEEEYLILAISRAYKKTYGKDMIFERESYGRDENIADLNSTVGWFTSQYPIQINVNEKYDGISLMTDVYNVKSALKDVKHLGLNYASLIYTTNELTYKHCPVTFNFLSDEFTFKNELFKSYSLSSSEEDVEIKGTEDESYGITFNVFKGDGFYNILGDYADKTYISNRFELFIENIKWELDFIADYDFENGAVVCCLSEPQLGVYLDEKIHDKGTAYASPASFDCGDGYSVDEVKNAIHALINKHPILKGRVVVTEDMPLLVCDANPSIEIVDSMDNDFIKEFDFEISLIRFFIINNPEGIKIFYDMHHMISDATTTAIIDKELNMALSGELDDNIDYGFLYASRDSFESKFDLEYENAEKFFKDKFADIDEVQYLTNDVNGSVGKVGLPIRGVREAVERFAHDLGITVSNFLNAVFAYAYSRFTGSDKVYYNFTEHGRHEDYSKEAISMFVRTIPILVNCENMSINDYLVDVSDLILDSMSNNIYPFRLLAKDFNLNMDITFEYNYDLNDMSDIGDEITFYDVGDRVAELLCVVNDLDDGYYVGISHLDRYSQDTIARFAYVFKEVLIQFLDKSNLKDIDYISNEDIKLLDNINQTDYPLKVHDILYAFNNNLSKYQDNTLVSFDNRRYSYGEGAFIANKLARYLLELGINNQDHVAFLVERSELYIFNILGIMSAGAIYVPLDDKHPDERIKFILEDTDAKVVIVSDKTLERAEKLTKDSILFNVSDILKENIESSNYLPVNYNDLACILYTSGTTGLPKGVKITRKSLLNVAAFYCDSYNLNMYDIYGLFSAIGFDVSNFIISAVLYSGSSLSIIPEDIRLDMVEMNNYFIKHGVTHTFITTQVGKLFLQSVEDTTLNVLLVAGEKLGHVESPDGYELVDAYGPTEAFAFMSSINNLDKIHESSVGLLNYNTKVYVLDKEHRRVPIGAVGELYIAGHQLAEGYLNREEETQKAFIKNPFDDGDYGIIYNTGDSVRILPDGTIGIIGRSDGQVKIRGNRVELSEVESAIRQIDNIDDVSVQTIYKHGNNELAAYVVTSCDIDNLKDYVRDHISKSKPYYMVPSYVVELDVIPLNVNGKVDKQKLPEISTENKDYEPPKTPLEKTVANVFSEVLNIQPIGRNDEFSQLGGDSIGVIMLISKLGDLNIQIGVKEVLENQSVKKIAENAVYKLSPNNISQEPFEGFVDMAPMIQYFWDLNLKNPSYFNVPFLLEASKRIDVDILEKAMMAVVNHHDILRAIVKDQKLFVRPPNSEKVFTIDYCNPLDYTNETLRINEGVDIFNGPLIKLAIFKDENADYLYGCIHHLLADANSIRIIINNLNLAYAQISRNKKVNLYNKTSSYQDYAKAINKYKNSEEILKQKSCWENTLTSLKEIKHTEINSEVRQWNSFSSAFPKIINTPIFVNAPKYYNCSVEGLFLAMISKSWKDVMGDDKLSVSLNNDERFNFDENILTERTVGWFDSFYPVILKCEGQDNKEIISNTQKILDNIPHNGFDYHVLMDSKTKEIPLLTYSYLREFNELHAGKMFSPVNRADSAYFTAEENNFGCDMNIVSYTVNNETFFIFEYNNNRFEEKLMKKFGQAFIKNMNEIIEFNKEDYTSDIHMFSDHPDKKKLFFVHTINFGSEYFYSMAQQLKDDYTFIVIEPYNRNHKENQLRSIEEYASKYVEIIKSIQPEGPYYIGGYCFGGVIAHEIAVQLEKQNDKVEKLVQLEAYNIDDEKLTKLMIEDQILFAREFVNEGILDSKHEHIEDMISYVLSSTSIMYNYKPGYYDGDVIYFKSTVQSEGFSTDVSETLNDYFMSRKAGGYEDYYNAEKLKIVHVPVDHDSLLNIEALKIVIPELKKFIDGSD